MRDKPDPGKRRNPAATTMRELVKRSAERDRKFARTRNQLKQPQNRWQRFVRYVWDKNRGRG